MIMIINLTAKVIKTMIFIEMAFNMLQTLGNKAETLADYLEEADKALE